MFNNSKYTKKYYSIINQAKLRMIEGYYERHHIIPKSLSGSNENENIVKLTAREHFVCHLLLIKMVDKNDKYKMVYAAWQLSRPTRNKDLKVTNRVYEMLKKELSETYTGRKRKPFCQEAINNMSEAHKGEKNFMYGKHHSEETKSLISRNRKGKKVGKDNSFYGKTHSPETIALIAQKSSLKQKGKPKPKAPCQYCGLMVAANIMKRYHGDNCKLRK